MGTCSLGSMAMYRWRALGPHASLLLRPSGRGYQYWRALSGFGLRGYLPVGPTEISYGVGAHFEARLEDHYWLAHATLLELGTPLTRAGSWNIGLFAGARYAFTGQLINFFLVDPNGFDNENAQDDLDIARGAPWRGFVRVVFARRID